MSEKHTEDCAIHGCEGWNGPRHCDCGAEAAPPQPSAPPDTHFLDCGQDDGYSDIPDAPSASAEPSKRFTSGELAFPDTLPSGQEREEAERAELEREWLTQSQWLDYGNWLQAELLKARAALRASGKEGV